VAVRSATAATAGLGELGPTSWKSGPASPACSTGRGMLCNSAS
jgi:hypothetical protein